MPRFQIKRKTKKAEPEPILEEKIDDTEMSYESVSDESSETEPLESEMQTLKIEDSPKPERKVRFEPQKQAPQQVRRTTVARPQTNPVRYGNSFGRQAPARPQMLGQPRSMTFPKPSRLTNGSRRLQFRSHYGPDGNYMSTQDKARRLYYSCFG